MNESVKKHCHMLRQKVSHQDFQRTIHYTRTVLDRQTAAILLSCWNSATYVGGNFTVDLLLYQWHVQQMIWQQNVEPEAGRPFTIGDFVTYLLCAQEERDGHTLRNRNLFEHQIEGIQRHMDKLMHDVERDLQLAGFLAVTNKQIELRAMRLA